MLIKTLKICQKRICHSSYISSHPYNFLVIFSVFSIAFILFSHPIDQSFALFFSTFLTPNRLVIHIMLFYFSHIPQTSHSHYFILIFSHPIDQSFTLFYSTLFTPHRLFIHILLCYTSHAPQTSHSHSFIQLFSHPIDQASTFIYCTLLTPHRLVIHIILFYTSPTSLLYSNILTTHPSRHPHSLFYTSHTPESSSFLNFTLTLPIVIHISLINTFNTQQLTTFL